MDSGYRLRHAVLFEISGFVGARAQIRAATSDGEWGKFPVLSPAKLPATL